MRTQAECTLQYTIKCTVKSSKATYDNFFICNSLSLAFSQQQSFIWSLCWLHTLFPLRCSIHCVRLSARCLAEQMGWTTTIDWTRGYVYQWLSVCLFFFSWPSRGGGSFRSARVLCSMNGQGMMRRTLGRYLKVINASHNGNGISVRLLGVQTQSHPLGMRQATHCTRRGRPPSTHLHTMARHEISPPQSSRSSFRPPSVN